MAKAQMVSKTWFSTSEAAQELEVHQNTVISWCKHYEGFAKRVGSRWRIQKDALETLKNGDELPIIKQ